MNSILKLTSFDHAFLLSPLDSDMVVNRTHGFHPFDEHIVTGPRVLIFFHNVDISNTIVDRNHVTRDIFTVLYIFENAQDFCLFRLCHTLFSVSSQWLH